MSSHLIGHVRTTYARLVQKFGSPNRGPDYEGGDFKVSCEWVLSFSDANGQEREFRVYDWKTRCCTPRDEYAWHVGGSDASHMEAIREIIPTLSPGEGHRAYVIAKGATGYITLKTFQNGAVVRETSFGEALRTMAMSEMDIIMQMYGSARDIDTEGAWTLCERELIDKVFISAWLAPRSQGGRGDRSRSPRKTEAFGALSAAIDAAAPRLPEEMYRQLCDRAKDAFDACA